MDRKEKIKKLKAELGEEQVKYQKEIWNNLNWEWKTLIILGAFAIAYIGWNIGKAIG